MFRFLIGVGIGVVITMFYPDIVPVAKTTFLESGVRDVMVDTLKEIK